jgi:hypothetical protein
VPENLYKKTSIHISLKTSFAHLNFSKHSSAQDLQTFLEGIVYLFIKKAESSKNICSRTTISYSLKECYDSRNISITLILGFKLKIGPSKMA